MNTCIKIFLRSRQSIQCVTLFVLLALASVSLLQLVIEPENTNTRIKTFPYQASNVRVNERAATTALADAPVRPRASSIRKQENIGVNATCEKRLSDAIIIGVEKSGTSALLLFLDHHPEIRAVRSPEESHFFTRFYARGFEWYRSIMPCSFPGEWVIEKTPGYIYFPEAAQRIQKYKSDVKLVVIMKDPVERLLSAFAMYVAQGKMKVDDLESAVFINGNDVSTDHRMVNRSLYVEHLKPWFEFFKRDDILFLDGNNFKSNPYEELHKVETFLGLRNFYQQNDFRSDDRNRMCIRRRPAEGVQCLPPYKGRSHPPVPPDVRTRLQQFFAPRNKQLFEMIGETFTWQYSD